MKKKRYIIISIIFLILLSIPTTYLVLRRQNQYVAYWDDLPKETKLWSIKLEIERIWHKVFTPEISEDIIGQITPELLERSINDGADWIVSMQEKSGRYNYWYDPANDSYSAESDDNFLRQGGTGYSLTTAYEMTGNKNFLQSAKKNLEYLFKFKRILDDDKAYFLFGEKAKLGGIALPMLSMLKIRDITGDSIYDKDLKLLANMMLYLQNQYNTGQFKSTYVYFGDFEYEKTSGWESKIYPGEAMLALAFMYQQFGDEKYKNSLDWAYDFYSKKRRWRKSSFIPWTASAFSELYKVTEDKKYADFVFKMCNRTLKRQNLNPNYEIYGSFDGLPTVFTATSFEGIGDAISIAKIMKDEEIVRRYSKRAKIAYKWLMYLQYKSEKTSTKLPSQAIGGFRKSLNDSVIRIDNTQHAISAMVKGLKYIFEQKPKVKSEKLITNSNED